MKNFFQFTPEMFSQHIVCTSDDLARMANIKLQTAIEAAPLVFGDAGKDHCNDTTSVCWTKLRAYSVDTHRARLICIEQLPKVECSHEPAIDSWIDMKTARCIHCSTELKATWSVK